MSSTANVQSYLPYAFRPVYAWDSNVGAFSTSFNLSNVDSVSTGTLTTGLLNVGDSNQNVYLGTSSGNIPTLATSTNTYRNTAMGVSAGGGTSNTSNSEFIGYLCGSSTNGIYNTFIGGSGAGSNAYQLSNCVLIGTSNSVALSNATNVVSIGGNSGGTGSNSVYLGTYTGLSNTGSSNIIVGSWSGNGFTGSNNVVIGNGLSPTISNGITATLSSGIVSCTIVTPDSTNGYTGISNLISGQTVTISGFTSTTFNGSFVVSNVTTTTFTYSNGASGSGSVSGVSPLVQAGIPPARMFANSSYFCNVLSTTSNGQFFIGNQSNVLMSGDFKWGTVVIGGANAVGYALSNCLGVTKPTNINPISGLVLDVTGYARFQTGLSIGTDPGVYSLDVSGNMSITDGNGAMFLSSNYDGASNTTGAASNSYMSLQPVQSGGTMNLLLNGQSRATYGYSSLQNPKGGFLLTAMSSLPILNTTVDRIGNSTTTSNVIPTTMSGTLVANVATSAGAWNATYVISNGAGTPIGSSNTTGTTNFAVSIGSTPTTIVISNTSAPSTFYYNFTFYPFG